MVSMMDMLSVWWFFVVAEFVVRDGVVVVVITRHVVIRNAG